MARRILFLDGLGCNPGGFKPAYIRSLGYEVEFPMLPDLDFPASVAVAQKALEQFRPDVVVGYSRGGAVALSFEHQTPLVLIAPALHLVAARRATPARIVILQSATDDLLPLDDCREQMARCGLPALCLRVVGTDHTMIDAEALAALQEALS